MPVAGEHLLLSPFLIERVNVLHEPGIAVPEEAGLGCWRRSRRKPFCFRRADAATAPFTVPNGPEILSSMALSEACVMTLRITASTFVSLRI